MMEYIRIKMRKRKAWSLDEKMIRKRGRRVSLRKQRTGLR